MTFQPLRFFVLAAALAASAAFAQVQSPGEPLIGPEAEEAPPVGRDGASRPMKTTAAIGADYTPYTRGAGLWLYVDQATRDKLPLSPRLLLKVQGAGILATNTRDIAVDAALRFVPFRSGVGTERELEVAVAPHFAFGFDGTHEFDPELLVRYYAQELIDVRLSVYPRLLMPTAGYGGSLTVGFGWRLGIKGAVGLTMVSDIPRVVIPQLTGEVSYVLENWGVGLRAFAPLGGLYNWGVGLGVSYTLDTPL